MLLVITAWGTTSLHSYVEYMIPATAAATILLSIG